MPVACSYRVRSTPSSSSSWLFASIFNRYIDPDTLVDLISHRQVCYVGPGVRRKVIAGNQEDEICQQPHQQPSQMNTTPEVFNRTC